MNVEQFLTSLRNDLETITRLPVVVGRTETQDNHIGIDYLGSNMTEPTLCLDLDGQLTTHTVSFRVFGSSLLNCVQISDLVAAQYKGKTHIMQGVNVKYSELLNTTTADLTDSRRFLMVVDYSFII